MDTSLRLILLLVALLIMAGIFWDILRSRRSARRLRKTTKEPKWSFRSPDSNLEIKLDAKSFEVDPPKEIAADEVIVLIVMARQPGVFQGKKLLEAFNEAQLYFGEFEIFHRHEHPDGSGKVLFSVASAIEPGVFELSKMDGFVTPGITLFFSPERRNQSIATFELMLRTAKLLAQRMDGEVKDQERRPLTLASIEKYREQVRRPHVESNAGYSLEENN